MANGRFFVDNRHEQISGDQNCALLVGGIADQANCCELDLTQSLSIRHHAHIAACSTAKKSGIQNGGQPPRSLSALRWVVCWSVYSVDNHYIRHKRFDERIPFRRSLVNKQVVQQTAGYFDRGFRM
jgi:hypothetical protein